MLLLVPLHSTGLTGVADAKVHLGFLDAYNAVALDVLRIVQDQLAVHPSYRIIVTGHSLGGAIAALGAISIKSALPSVPIKLFTFGVCSYWLCVGISLIGLLGQPRVGNTSFADYVERLIGVNNIFRGAYSFTKRLLLAKIYLSCSHLGFVIPAPRSYLMSDCVPDGVVTLPPQVLGYQH